MQLLCIMDNKEKSRIKQLVEKTLQGDKDSFCELVVKYQHAVYGLAFHHLKNFTDAEDIAQEVFLEAYRQLRTLRRPERFGFWLNGITTNLCKMWLRRQRPIVSIDELQQHDELTTNPDEFSEQHELHELVMEAISQLPEPNRIVLTLYSIDGLSYGEISEFLDVPIGTVRSRIHRAKQTLKKELADMVAQDFKKHEIDPEFAPNVVKFLKEQQDRIITLWSDDMAVINDKVSKAIHRNAISSFLSLIRDQFKHTDITKTPDELIEALTRRYKELTASELAEMLFLFQGMMVLNFLNDYDMDLFGAIYQQIMDIIESYPGKEDIKWGFSVGFMDITETASAIRLGSRGTYGSRYFSENQAKKNLYHSYMVNIGNPSDPIQIPISVNKSWVERDSGYKYRSIIVNTGETINTPAGEFPDCVKVKTLITGKKVSSDGKETPEIDVFVRGRRFMWFAPGVGLVKLIYEHEEGSATEVSLISYLIKEASDSYLPLALGNIWRYEWTDTYSDYMNWEVWRVAEKKKDTYRIHRFNRVSRPKESSEKIDSTEQETPEREKILIVSDRDSEQKIYKNILLDEGYDVETTNSGMEALNILQKLLFNLVVMYDFDATKDRTPEMMGIELLEKIKQTSPDTQIIVMTAFGTVEKTVKMMRLGAYDILELPFSPVHLLTSVKEALEIAKM